VRQDVRNRYRRLSAVTAAVLFATGVVGAGCESAHGEKQPDGAAHPSCVTIQNRIDLAEIWGPLSEDDLDGLSLGRSVCVGSDGAVFIGSQLGLVSFRIDENGKASRGRLVLPETESTLGPLDFSPNGRRLAIGYANAVKVDVLEVNSSGTLPPATARTTIEVAEDEMRGTWLVAWRTNDELLVWSTDGVVRCLDVRTRKTRWTHAAGSGYVVRSLNREFLLIPSLTARDSVVLRTANGRQVAKLTVDEGHAETNQFGAVSDDGQCAVIGRYRHSRFHSWRRGRDGVLTFGVPGSGRETSGGLCFVPGGHRLLVHWPDSIFLVAADSGDVLDWCDVSGSSADSGWGPAWGMRVTPDGQRCLLLTDRELIVLSIR